MRSTEKFVVPWRAALFPKVYNAANYISHRRSRLEFPNYRYSTVRAFYTGRRDFCSRREESVRRALIGNQPVRMDEFSRGPNNDGALTGTLATIAAAIMVGQWGKPTNSNKFYLPGSRRKYDSYAAIIKRLKECLFRGGGINRLSGRVSRLQINSVPTVPTSVQSVNRTVHTTTIFLQLSISG